MYDLIVVLTYGVTFGIVLMTIVYTFIRSIYSKEIFYISYSIMQIFSLVYILAYSKLFDFHYLFLEISLVGASLSALVFAFNFYNISFIPKISNYKELLVNTLFLNIVILSAFYHYMVFEYLPYTIIYGILFLSIIFNAKDNFKSKGIYVFGWSIICIALFIWDFKGFYTNKGYIDLLLLAFAIEAVLFTFLAAYKYNSLKQQSKQYENMLFQQSKLAQSGQMIQNITHQFRQPLNNLSYILMNLKTRYENQKLTQNYFHKKYEQANSQLKFLSKTIDDFKDFYTLTKHKENFFVEESISSALTVISADLKKHNIQLDIEYKTNSDVMIYGIKSELSQVLLSLLFNAKDELKNIEKPEIKIIIDSNSAFTTLSIEDNAGGIKNINKIFQPYFTTKKDGLGIGLYLVKEIIEKTFDGKIEVENKKEGACFTLFFEKVVP